MAFLICVCASAASAAVTKDYLLATVLFYTDEYGQKVVAAGPVPSKIDKTIRNDIKIRLKDALVKVIPLFTHSRNAPRADEITRYIKDSYDTVFVAELSKTSRNIIYTKHNKDIYNIYIHKDNIDRSKILGEDTADSIRNFGRMMKNRINAFSLNADTMDKANPSNSFYDNTNVLDQNDVIIKQPAQEYLPDIVFYAIENKCHNWTDDCDLPKAVDNMNKATFKYVLPNHN